MKRIFCLLIALVFSMLLVSCADTSADTKSTTSKSGTSSVPTSSAAPNSTDGTSSDNGSASLTDSSVAASKTTSSKASSVSKASSSKAAPSAEDEVVEDVLPSEPKNKIFSTPDKVFHTVNGIRTEIVSASKIEDIVVLVEGWSTTKYKLRLAVGERLITDLTENEETIELYYDTKPFLGTIMTHHNFTLLIPVSGDYRNVVFTAYNGQYVNNPFASGLYGYKTDDSLNKILG